MIRWQWSFFRSDVIPILFGLTLPSLLMWFFGLNYHWRCLTKFCLFLSFGWFSWFSKLFSLFQTNYTHLLSMWWGVLFFHTFARLACMRSTSRTVFHKSICPFTPCSTNQPCSTSTKGRWGEVEKYWNLLTSKVSQEFRLLSPFTIHCEGVFVRDWGFQFENNNFNEGVRAIPWSSNLIFHRISTNYDQEI